MKGYLQQVLADKNLNMLNGLSKRFMIDYYNNKGDYPTSLATADKIVKDYPTDKDLLCDVEFEKGLIYQYYLNQADNAEKYYSNVVNNYPNNLLAKAAARHLRRMGKEMKENPDESLVAKDTVSNFSVSNYPNPFNPSTTISYSIPKASKVEIKVYDVLGREVATLVNEFKSAGKYDVVFNAANLTSGVYFYRLKVNDLVATKKIILAK